MWSHRHRARQFVRHIANYKHFLEVWLDTLYHEYELDARPVTTRTRDPARRKPQPGTCFTHLPNDAIVVDNSSQSSTTPLVPIDIDLGRFDIGAIYVRDVALARRGGGDPRSRAVATITRWSSLDAVSPGSSRRDASCRNVRCALTPPRILRVLIDRWAKLRPDDARTSVQRSGEPARP